MLHFSVILDFCYSLGSCFRLVLESVQLRLPTVPFLSDSSIFIYLHNSFLCLLLSVLFYYGTLNSVKSLSLQFPQTIRKNIFIISSLYFKFIFSSLRVTYIAIIIFSFNNHFNDGCGGCEVWRRAWVQIYLLCTSSTADFDVRWVRVCPTDAEVTLNLLSFMFVFYF